MSIRLQRYDPSSAIHIVWGPMAFMFLVAAGMYKGLIGLLPRCIFHELTGIPCLTCGATRSAVSLSGFDLISSLMYNPLVPLFFIGVMALSLTAFAGVVFNKSLKLELTPVQRKSIRITVICLIVANWVYLVAAGI
jgi:hypothetical protein